MSAALSTVRGAVDGQTNSPTLQSGTSAAWLASLNIKPAWTGPHSCLLCTWEPGVGSGKRLGTQDQVSPGTDASILSCKRWDGSLAWGGVRAQWACRAPFLECQESGLDCQQRAETAGGRQEGYEDGQHLTWLENQAHILCTKKLLNIKYLKRISKYQKGNRRRRSQLMSSWWCSPIVKVWES